MRFIDHQRKKNILVTLLGTEPKKLIETFIRKKSIEDYYTIHEFCQISTLKRVVVFLLELFMSKKWLNILLKIL